MPDYVNGTKINYGCGTTRFEGFLGMDRFALKGVDIVANFDDPLPLEDNSVDVVYASHSLEHVTSLAYSLGELYRVCKDKALIVVLAPYSYTSGNESNIYHIAKFNEQTFRFFTKCPEFYTPPEDVFFPSIPDVWGLSASDHSDNPVDFRTIYQNYIYFPAYQELDEETRRIYRITANNVCEMIVYYLVVVKDGSLTHAQADDIKPFGDRVIAQTCGPLLAHYAAQKQSYGFPAMLSKMIGEGGARTERALNARIDETAAALEEQMTNRLAEQLKKLDGDAQGRENKLSGALRTLTLRVESLNAKLTESQRQLSLSQELLASSAPGAFSRAISANAPDFWDALVLSNARLARSPERLCFADAAPERDLRFAFRANKDAGKRCHLLVYAAQPCEMTLYVRKGGKAIWSRDFQLRGLHEIDIGALPAGRLGMQVVVSSGAARVLCAGRGRLAYVFA